VRQTLNEWGEKKKKGKEGGGWGVILLYDDYLADSAVREETRGKGGQTQSCLSSWPYSPPWEVKGGGEKRGRKKRGKSGGRCDTVSLVGSKEGGKKKKEKAGKRNVLSPASASAGGREKGEKKKKKKRKEKEESSPSLLIIVRLSDPQGGKARRVGFSHGIPLRKRRKKRKKRGKKGGKDIYNERGREEPDPSFVGISKGREEKKKREGGGGMPKKGSFPIIQGKEKERGMKAGPSCPVKLGGEGKEEERKGGGERESSHTRCSPRKGGGHKESALLALKGRRKKKTLRPTANAVAGL